MKAELNKVLYFYCDLKGYDVGDLAGSDYGRFYKVINQLLERSKGDVDMVNDGLSWLDGKAKDEYDWTLETLNNKKWLDFKKEYDVFKREKELERIYHGKPKS